MTEGKNIAKSEGLYFIAIIPSDPIFTEALLLKNYFREVYNSKASLNSPPHITLHMPFKWKEAKEKALFRLESFAMECSSFELQLNGFNCFKPRVIYMNVVQNEELIIIQKALNQFCKTEFNLFNANHQDNPFHPHLTLAFRDLKKHKFAEAWEEFRDKKFTGSWKVGSFVLLKHDGKEWRSFREFEFKN
jgi:2'-5' RNA ligase